jgi:hypothetical protein
VCFRDLSNIIEVESNNDTNEGEYSNEKQFLDKMLISANNESNFKYRFAKPTKQWENKCKTMKEIHNHGSNIESIEKL